MIAVLNGEKGWEINQFAGVNEPTDYDEKKIKSYGKSVSIDDQLWFLKRAGANFKLLGKEELNGKMFC